MTISILCVGDPHFKKTNITDVDEFIIRMKELVEEKKPDIIVVLGDLLHYHDTYYYEPFNRAIKFLKMLSDNCPTFLIVGNHDLSCNQDYLSDKHAYIACKEWKNMIIVDEVKKYEKEDFTFFFVPYVFPGRFEEALNTSNDVWELADCIFCHQEFEGCRMQSITSSDGDKWNEDYPLVISGHIHGAQTVGTNIYYPGSSMQHNYGDGEDKKIWLVNFSKNDELELEVEIDKIDLGLPKRKIITLTPNEAKKFDINAYKNTHIKLIIKTTHSEYQSFRKSRLYKKLSTQGIIITYKPTIIMNKNEMSKKVKDSHEKYGGSFNTALHQLVKEEKDNGLTKVYTEILKITP